MNHVCVAGTFDHIHAGHEALFSKAFAASEHVLVGVTSDVFVATYKKNSLVRPSDARKQDVRAWLDSHGYSGRYDIVLIDNPYEPAVSDASLEGLVVSEESKGRANEINTKRIALGIAPLTIITVSLVPAEDGKPISSSRVRTGVIDATGNLILPKLLRDQLTKPMGKILKTHEEVVSSFLANKDLSIALVGDATTKVALDLGVKPSLIVIDNKVERKVFTGLSSHRALIEKNVHRIVSGPAFIAKEALDAIASWGVNPEHLSVLEIEGEEDLLTLPVIIHAPIGSIVYYGQPARHASQGVAGGPQQGLVEVIVTEDIKKQAQMLLSQFVSP